MNTIARGLVVIGLVTGAAACALLGGASEDIDMIPAAQVQVVNKNWSDTVIYVDENGRRFRLGIVTSLETERLALPSSATGTTIRLIASPIGASAVHVTEPLLVRPGELVEFQVENYLPISTVAVWRSE